MPRLRSLRTHPDIDVLSRKSISAVKLENNKQSGLTVKRFVLQEKNAVETKTTSVLFHQPAVNLKNAKSSFKKINEMKNVKTQAVLKENKNKLNSKQAYGPKKKSLNMLKKINFPSEIDDLILIKNASNVKRHQRNNLKKGVNCLKGKENSNRPKILPSKTISTKNFLQKAEKSNKNPEREFSAKTSVTKTPIYMKNLKFIKPRPVRKKTNLDIYDISQDEDMSCKEVTKKKRVKPIKRNAPKKKRCVAPVQNQKHSSQNTLPSCDDKMQKRIDLVQVSLPSCGLTADSGVLTTNETVEENCFRVLPTVENNIETMLAEPMDLDVLMPEVEVEDNVMFLSQIADEFEKSFLIPKMTSTPDQTGIVPQNHHASKLKDVSFIPLVNKKKQVIVETPVTSIVKDNVDKDITLFDSPSKPEKKAKKQGVIKLNSKNFIQMNLFESISKPPSSPDKLEESVLKPNKAYHTPDNFKVHLVKAKRMSSTMNKRTTKSKEELLIEKMSQHFEEISGTELCVE